MPVIGMCPDQDSNYEQRTKQQNRALHKLFAQLADVLNDSGYDMKAVLKPEVEIPWTPESVKNHLWRPIQEIMIDVESTADCKTVDYKPVYETLCRHLSGKLGIVPPPFPDRFSQAQQKQYNAENSEVSI